MMRARQISGKTSAVLLRFQNNKIWQDAQHQYMDIVQLVGQQPAPHVVGAIAATVHTPPTPRPTPCRGAALAAEVAVVGPAEV